MENDNAKSKNWLKIIIFFLVSPVILVILLLLFIPDFFLTPLWDWCYSPSNSILGWFKWVICSISSVYP